MWKKRSGPYNSPVSLTSWMICFCLFLMQNAYRVFESSHNWVDGTNVKEPDNVSGAQSE